MDPLPLPKKIEVRNSDIEHEAVITVEPCFPGYGMTLGNALRRVLLSSLPGAAVSALSIKNVQHEFSALPHMTEDIVGLILNVKLLRFRIHSTEPVTVSLKVKGERDVTAADIEATSDIEVVNPKQHLATLTDPAAELEMEMIITPGRGYVPVENREKEKLPLGTIAIDAIYTPVKNVNFDTEHVRVEQMTNFDRLIMTIRTDGTISPVEAFRQASIILTQHFNFLEGIAEEERLDHAPAKKKRSPKAKPSGDEEPSENLQAI